jgi:hypothetical protein
MLPVLILFFLFNHPNSASAQEDKLVKNYTNAICEKVASGEYPLSGEMGVQFLVMKLILLEANVRNPELIEGQSGSIFPGYDAFESSIVGNQLIGEIIRSCPEVGAEIAAITLGELEEETHDSKAGLFTFKGSMNKQEWMDLLKGLGKNNMKAIGKDKKRTLRESVFFYLDQSEGREVFYSVSTNGRPDFVETFSCLAAEEHPELAARFYDEKQLYSFGFSRTADKRKGPIDKFLAEVVRTEVRKLSEMAYGPSSEIFRKTFEDVFTQEVIIDLSRKLELSFDLSPMALREYMRLEAASIIGYYYPRGGMTKGYLQPYFIQQKLSFGPPVTARQVDLVNLLVGNYCKYLNFRNSRSVSREAYIKQEWRSISSVFPIRSRNDPERFETSLSYILPSSSSSCD